MNNNSDQVTRFERIGIPRTISTENYDIFNQICHKTSQKVQNQTMKRVASKGSQEQLFYNYDGNQYWQRQSHSVLAKYLMEVTDMIDDIMTLIDHLHSLNDEQDNNVFYYVKKQIRNLKLQLQITQELLQNCQDNETEELKKLKAKQINVKPIVASKATHVNMIMVNTISEYLVGEFFPNMLKIAKHALDHFHDQQSGFLQDIKIIGTQLAMINIAFSSAVDYDKQSLFSLDRNHNDWKSLYQICTRKTLGDPDKIKKSFDTFAQSILIGHAVVSTTANYNSPLLKKLIFGVQSMYYQIFDAKKDAYTHMSQLKMKNALEVMNLIEQPEIKRIMSVGYENILVNCKLYIEPVVLPVTMQWITNQINQNLINKVIPTKLKLVNEDNFMNPNYKELLFAKNKSKLRIRLLCSEAIDDSYRKWYHFGSKDPVQLDTVLIHIHGGGFIAHSSSSHQSYTRVWANQLGIPIFSIDYSLAPQFPYPTALDDCWQAYNWILLYVHKYFDISPKVVIVTGDSAGGNLACSLTGLAIKLGQRIPDGVLLSYPALDLRFGFSPSYIYALEDKIIGHTILGLCISAYTANPLTQLHSDPFISPLMFSDEIISKFPPTRMICGSKDPLHDNIWQFALMLLKQQRNAKMIVYEDMYHGFLNFNTIKGMQEIQTCINDASLLISELIDIAKISI